MASSYRLGGRNEAGQLLRLAGPLMLAQSGLVLMGLVDTWCIGRVSTLDMAGVALGNALTLVLMGVGLGIAMGIEPLVAQAFGAGEFRRAHAWRHQGLWATALVCLPATLGVIGLAAILPSLGWARGFEGQTQGYLLGRCPGVLLMCLYTSYRGYLSSVGRAQPALRAVIFANIANLLLDLVFLFALELGAMGVGLATSLASGVMLWVVRRAVRETARPDDRRPVWADMKAVFRLGWPIAGQLTAEIGVFAAASALVASEGPVDIASHQIALGMASLFFMAAMGIAVAGTARVGHHVGAADTPMARHTGFLAMALGAGLMAFGALVLWTIPEPIAAVFAPESPAVIQLASTLLRIAAVFAVSDGVQAVAAGTLRGLGDTRSPLIANLTAHGLVGAPVALGLGWVLDLGTVGYWWGITAGLTATALALALRFASLTSKPVLRAELNPISEEPSS